MLMVVGLRGQKAYGLCKAPLCDVLLEWTTSLDTSSRTLFVREGGTMCVGMSTS